MSGDYNFFQIGVDDTDSAEGMCTTFLCYSAVKRLLRRKKRQTLLTDYPHLIRLNPNIPWKTRGNAALSLQLRTKLSRREIFDYFKSAVTEFATSPKANSGLALYEGFEIPPELEHFSRRALFSVMSLREARDLIRKFGMDSFELRRGQGLVGAISSIGNLLKNDHTFELIAYRRNINRPREIDLSKIKKMSEARFPETFSNYDPEYGRVMITPHGPDPVLCGIRGETPRAVLLAFRDILPIRNLLGYMIFRSNQGTGEHLTHELNLGNAIPYTSGTATGKVTSRPTVETGGHVFFKIANEDGEIDCACYEPTADFRRVATGLITGDVVTVAGGIRKPTSLHRKMLNLELLRPLRLEPDYDLANPKCPICLKSLKSKGRNQGFACENCGYSKEEMEKRKIWKKRKISLKLYVPPMKAHRHLTRPIHRYIVGPKKFDAPARLIHAWME